MKILIVLSIVFLFCAPSAALAQVRFGTSDEFRDTKLNACAAATQKAQSTAARNKAQLDSAAATLRAALQPCQCNESLAGAVATGWKCGVFWKLVSDKNEEKKAGPCNANLLTDVAYKDIQSKQVRLTYTVKASPCEKYGCKVFITFNILINHGSYSNSPPEAYQEFPVEHRISAGHNEETFNDDLWLTNPADINTAWIRTMNVKSLTCTASKEG